MGIIVPFDTSEKCDVCQIRGAFDFFGAYLCEKCCREDNESEYDDEVKDEFYCYCVECQCEKSDNLI